MSGNGRERMPSSARDALAQGAESVRPTFAPTPSESTFPQAGDIWTTPIKNNPLTPNPDVPGIGEEGNLKANPNPPYAGGEPADAGPMQPLAGGSPQGPPPAATGGM